MGAKRCADRLVVQAHTAITSMPGYKSRYCPSMPGVLRALVCPDLSVTPGIRPYARCQPGNNRSRAREGSPGQADEGEAEVEFRRTTSRRHEAGVEIRRKIDEDEDQEDDEEVQGDGHRQLARAA